MKSVVHKEVWRMISLIRAVFIEVLRHLATCVIALPYRISREFFQQGTR
jgi:hypothetical protein